MALIDKLTSIADVIRLRTGNTNKMTLDEMANTVGKMSDCSNDTVTPGALALGVTAHDKNGALITGNLSVDCGYGPSDLVAGTTPLAAGSYYFIVNEAHRSVGNVYVGDENGVASLWAEREIHDWSFVERINPSCTVDGGDVYSCSCGETKRTNVVAASGHAYGTAYVSSEFSTGYGQKCSSCGHLLALENPYPRASERAVGSSVFMNVNGVRTEFIIVQQGLPNATLYDSSCNGTWLLMKNIYRLYAWNDNGALNYSESYIDKYLRNTFLPLLDAGVKNVIKEVTLYSKTGNTTTYYKINRKIFLLSANEVNGQNSQLLETKSSVLDYFNGASDSKRIAYFKGAATAWWLRNYYLSRNPTYVLAAGGVSHNAYTNEFGVRPALILPSDTLVDGSGNVVV